MNRMTTLALSVTLTFSMGAVTAGEWGQPGVFDSDQPGSVLVFPKFDISAQNATEIRITNDHPYDDVNVHLVYVCGEKKNVGDYQQKTCRSGNMTISLTAKETWTTDVQSNPQLSPVCDGGFIVAYAVDSSGNEIGFNHLMGSYHIDKLRPLRRSADQAITIQAKYCRNSDGAIDRHDHCGVDRDGELDFDGYEYEQLPSVLTTDFQAVKLNNPISSSEITLLTLDAVAGDLNYPTSVGLNWYNEDEQGFSGTHSFYCWDSVRLEQIDKQRFKAPLVDAQGNVTKVFMGSEHGLLRITPRDNNSADDRRPEKAVLGAIREVGPGFHTMRNMYNDGDAIDVRFTPDFVHGTL